MFKTTQILPKTKALFQHASLPAYGIILLIIFVFLFTYFILISPVSVAQKRNVMQIASQAEFPFTQHMAKQLLKHTSPVNKMQYFRLIRAYGHESRQIRTYPAYDPNRAIR